MRRVTGGREAYPPPRWRYGPDGGRRRRRRRGRRGARAAAALLAVLLVAAGAAWWARRPVPPPERAADFALEEAGGRQLALSDLRGRPVALVFFPTFLSDTYRGYLAELQRLHPQIRALGGTVVAIVVAPPEQVKAGKEELGLAFPVLADPAHAAAESYGVYDLLGDGMAAPAAFVIDRAGNIRWRYVGRGAADRPPVRRLLRELRRAAG